jgi:hypothetical protein
MILHTEWRGTNLVGMFVIRERLDSKQSTKLFDRVLYVDLVSDGNTLGEKWTEEKCDALRISGQHLLIHLEKSVRDVNGHCRSGHRGSSL